MTGSKDEDRAKALLAVLVEELEAAGTSLEAMEQSLDELLEDGVLDRHTVKVLGGVREEVRGTLMLTEDSGKEVTRVLADLD